MSWDSDSAWDRASCYTCGRGIRFGTSCSRCDYGEIPIIPEPTAEELAWKAKEAKRSEAFMAKCRKIEDDWRAEHERIKATYKPTVWRWGGV